MGEIPSIIQQAIDAAKENKGENHAESNALSEVNERPLPPHLEAIGQPKYEDAPGGYVIGAMLEAGSKYGVELLDPGKDSPDRTFLKQRADDCLGEEKEQLDALIKSGLLKGFACKHGGEENFNSSVEKEELPDLKLGKPLSQGDVAMAGIINCEVKWSAEAKKMDIDGQQYDAVLKKDVEVFKVGNQRVARLHMDEQGNAWYAVKCDRPLSSHQVEGHAQYLMREIITKHIRVPRPYEGVMLPMASVNETKDLPVLKGWAVKGGHISEARMQTKISLDETGAEAKQGAMAVTTRGGPNYLEIDGPYLLFITSPEASHPIFSYVINKDNFKDPKKVK